MIDPSPAIEVNEPNGTNMENIWFSTLSAYPQHESMGHKWYSVYEGQYDFICQS
jgi:hypothetical protein